MLVMIGDEQILSAKQVCHSCLMANRHGLPRWNRGKLSCGKALQESEGKQAAVYECQMGFQVTEIH